MTDTQRQNRWSWREFGIVMAVTAGSFGANFLLGARWFIAMISAYIIMAMLVAFADGIKNGPFASAKGGSTNLLGIFVAGFLPFCSGKPVLTMLGWAVALAFSMPIGYLFSILLRRSR